MVIVGLSRPAAAQDGGAAPSADDGCRDVVASPADSILRAGENAWLAGDRAAAIAAIERVAEGPGRELPYALLRAASLSHDVGDDARAESLRRRALAVADASARQTNGPSIGRVYSIAARLQLGGAEAAAARSDLAALRADPEIDRRFACHLVWVAISLADAGDLSAALALLDSIHRAVPSARSVTDAKVALVFRTNDAGRIDAALHEALAAFPGDVEFTVRLANRMKLAGHRDEARALLEGLLMRGEASPSLLGELLGLVSGNVSDAQLAHYTALAAEHPDLPALQMIVGVEHHYLHHYEQSNTYLLRTGTLIDHEPRIAMYLAMNYFHLGNQSLAEQYIERARAADRPDPDIDYCRAVIRVRQDPEGSAADLRRYLAYTSRRPDVDPGKQARVQQTLTLLEGCMRDSDPRACVEREVVQQARALAFREHYPGTVANAAVAPVTAVPAQRSLATRPRSRNPLVRIGLAVAAALLAFGIFASRRRRS
jgi:tetratricopeptide (TPR) repeat protein